MAINQKNSAEKEQKKDLFDESSLDEMEKAENYRIGFKLFQACFWFMFIFSILIFTTAVITNNTIFTVYGIIAMAAAAGVHIVYSAMVSAKGVMNSKYTEVMAKPYVIAVYIICMILHGLIDLTGNKPIVFLSVFITFIMLIFDGIFARRNMKVLEKMLNDNDEEE